MTCVPLNIMCSNRCAIPVMPGRSFDEPTCATQPHDTVGERCLGTSSTRMPFPSTCSSTAGVVAIAAAVAGFSAVAGFAVFDAARASIGASRTASASSARARGRAGADADKPMRDMGPGRRIMSGLLEGG